MSDRGRGDAFTIHVNDIPVRVFPGMSVKHALIAFDMDVYAAVMRSEMEVLDGHGFRVGMEGAVHEGARFRVRPRPDANQPSDPLAR